tara:strand:+ start:3987 stop:4916 length:930 start_codon:yes stop_codon:yes gene_type:complete
MKEANWKSRIDGLKLGDRLALSQFLTEIESSGDHTEVLSYIFDNLKNPTPIVGITGFPGAGKSSLINNLIKIYREKGKKVGVLAIDPSSTISGGSLLGDRARMEEHSVDENVFIRSLASQGKLGGLSKKTFLLSMIMCIFNFDIIFIETVGIGQSEIDITKLADLTILNVAPGLGDSIQAMKAGVMEVIDMIVVNKADKEDAMQTYNQLNSILMHSTHSKENSLSIILTHQFDYKKNNDIYNEIQARLSTLKKDISFPKESHDWLIKEILYEKIDLIITGKQFMLEKENLKNKKIDFETLIKRVIRLIK